jgi:hypothetical protein
MPTQRETGNRMIGGGAYVQVSGLGHQVPGSGVRVRVQVQEISHLPLIKPSSQVAGGSPGWRAAGFIHSVLHAVLHSVIHAVIQFCLCHRLSHLLRWRVAAPGGRWQALSIQPSMQSSIQSSMQSSNFASVIDSVLFSGGGWQPQVAGGGNYRFSPPLSPLFSPQRSPQRSPPLFPTANRYPPKPFSSPGV